MDIIPDLNFRGEVVTLINTDEDVIQNKAVQEILESLDGERTVKIEDLPPDVRYDGFNKKALYDATKVTRSDVRSLLRPMEPRYNQELFRNTSAQDSEMFQEEALRKAQKKAQNQSQRHEQMLSRVKSNRYQLQQELTAQLTDALNKRKTMNEVTPQHQALIEKLYLDLRLVNPELAFSLLTSSVEQPQTHYATTGAAHSSGYVTSEKKERKHKSSSRRHH